MTSEVPLYVRVSRKDLSVKFTASPAGSGVRIPLASQPAVTTELGRLVYYDFIYTVHGRTESTARPRVAYKLIEPDPWLLVIGAIMWEGILQGLAWDVIKGAAFRAIAFLQRQGLAPRPEREGTGVRYEMKATIGFHYTKYAEDGQALEDMFVGLKAAYERRSEPERLLPTRTEEFKKLAARHRKRASE